MAKSKRTKKIRGCLVGCGAVFLAGVILTVTLVGTTFVGYGQAIEAREELDRLHPNQAEFTPAADGRIDPERMRRFLAVREALHPHCEAITESQSAFARMAERSDSSPEPDRGFFLDVLKAIRRAPRIGRDFGGYVSERNEALLENEIGLGEYTWIYVTGYFSHLHQRPVGLMGEPAESGIYAERVFDEIGGMIRRHVERSPSPDAADHDRLGAWRDELDALDADPDRIPFEDGLPPEVADSLEPFVAKLESLACPAAGELDAVLTERRGAGFEHY